jgi:hypothetical protein
MGFLFKTFLNVKRDGPIGGVADTKDTYGVR